MKRVGFVIGLSLLSASPAFADFQAGLQAYNNGDFAQAVDLWTAEAGRGDVSSQFNLGRLYEKGVEGYPRDLPKAYAWYRLAAAQDAAQAKQALERLEPILTAGQIEEGNEQAIQIFGRWYRQNIGRDEQEYLAAKAKLEADRKARIEVERKAAAARAQRQRDLIAQRNADAKLASELEKESRAAAIRAAQQKAEEAKRRALIEQRRREEEERLAALQAEQEKQRKLSDARARLAELKAKQQGRAVPVQQVTSPQPAPATTQAAPAVTTRPEPVREPTPPKAVQTPVVTSQPVVAPQKPAPVQAASQSQPIQQPVTTQKTEPVVAARPEPAKTQPTPKAIEKPQPVQVEAPKPKPAAQPKAPAKETVASAPPPKPKTTMPVIENGLDKSVVEQIVQAANSAPLDGTAAKAEIDKGRTNIEALKWSLISAARGKGSAKRMNEILAKNMSPVQIAEANRRAAEWLSERQQRQ